LGTIREKLRDSRATCALFNTDLFRRNIEAAYHQMWQRWLAGEKPKGFSM
jgi:predicted O-linked N-acetylglucosamine transferase (SPINDLY family)